jgi:PB1 domain
MHDHYWFPDAPSRLLMAMPFVPFKFKKSNAPTRIAEFDAQPSWGDLASKIAQLFNIPLKDVGVTYFDKAQDAVTITNEQGLQHFYYYMSSKLDQSSEENKFVVQDLRNPDGESDFPRNIALVSSLLLRIRSHHLALLITFITCCLLALIHHSLISPNYNHFNLVSGFQSV